VALVRSGVRYWLARVGLSQISGRKVITGLGPGGNASEAEAMMGTDGCNR
jgi:hypothetical protein